MNHVTKGARAEVVVKLESFNPLSSVKDRIGVAMIVDAEEKGLIKPDNEGKLIVVILPDTGERYLSTWLFQELY